MLKKTLVTGASGLVGRSLTAALSNQGCELSLLSANKRKKNGALSYFRWNPSEGYIDPACLDEVDTIIHLAGAGIAEHRWSPAYKKLILDSRVRGAELLFNLAEKRNIKIRKFISASGTGIYDSGSDEVYTETGTPGKGFLTEVCRQWEAAAGAFVQNGAMVGILRTGVVLAPDGGFLEPFKLAMKFRMLPILGTKRQYISWIHLDDLVAMYTRMALEPDFNGVYNAVAPEFVTQNEFLHALSAAARRKCLYPQIPAGLIKLLFGGQSELLLNDQKVSARKLLSEGFVFKFPTLKEALANLYART